MIFVSVALCQQDIEERVGNREEEANAKTYYNELTEDSATTNYDEMIEDHEEVIVDRGDNDEVTKNNDGNDDVVETRQDNEDDGEASLIRSQILISGRSEKFTNCVIRELKMSKAFEGVNDKNMLDMDVLMVLQQKASGVHKLCFENDVSRVCSDNHNIGTIYIIFAVVGVVFFITLLTFFHCVRGNKKIDSPYF